MSDKGKNTNKSLNSIRVPVVVLRQIAVELFQLGEGYIGLEDLLITIKARLAKITLDKDT